eukprot:2536483-Amphidinium_carterae.1
MLSVLHDNILQAIAFEASQIKVTRDAEEIFSAGEEMSHAILLSRGCSKYTMTPSLQHGSGQEAVEYGRASTVVINHLQGMKTVEVLADTWICEHSLFLEWSTMGAMAALAVCELLLVSSEQFRVVVSLHPVAAAVSAAYAVRLSSLLRFGAELCGNLSDVDAGVDHDVVLSGMHTSIRSALVSSPILEMLRRQQRFKELILGIGFGELETELEAGNCHLMLGPDGPSSIQRCVRLVLLQLTNSEGHLCVQLADVADGVCNASLHLPVGRVTGNETPADAVRRVIEEKIHILASGIQLVAVDTLIEYGASATYGMRTKYIKHVCTAELTGRMEKDESAAWALGNSSMGMSLSTSIKSEPRLQASRIASDWSDWVKPAGSDSCTASSSLLRQPFSTDGTKCAFAVHGLNTEADKGCPSRNPNEG